MLELTAMAILYAKIGFLFLLFFAFIAGFNGRELNRNDLLGSIFWIVTLFNEGGAFVRFIIEIIKKRKNTK